jgi:hypothetical protein
VTAISLTVDARQVKSDVFPDGDIRQFLDQWRDLEQMLRGKVLHAGVSFPVHVTDGELRMEVVYPIAPVRVDEHTEFGIVAVREKPSVRSVYQCATCRREGQRTYGPFICQQCPQQDRRVCDRHAVVLAGSLTTRCPQHQPDCRGCGATAAVWCPGPRCGSRVGWCRSHSASHSSEPATSYCLPCLAQLFPPCGVGQCDKVGSINCDHVLRDGRVCDARRCPRHARRWQVFGPHAEGLGRCEDHAHLRGQPAEELIYQVLGACAVRQLREPSLAGLRHMLMKLTERNRDMRHVFDLTTMSPAAAPPTLQRQLGDLVARRKKRWWEEVIAAEESLEQRTAQLKDWLNRQGNCQAASYLEGKHWARPRNERPGTLYVTCDARLLPRPWRDAASAALGFDVRLETRP